ncbi:diguanylate cyclase (GGDEF)-like protein [Thermovibrio guaymasensis]|uniref:diguanylate cyclase n=1 Tax=Thermovibrio guaymasensis TaxID=240167 RepID=A0A420W5R6_9BACT|nr:GGDEF domain-containing protein [Thermovibrio guaymasensis]RKQ60354.1 diguanylate cyclase (GGDEF)-like protein [Thermovibrio guaymasensis]
MINSGEKKEKKAFAIGVISVITFLFLISFGYYNYAFNLRKLGIFELVSGLAVLLNFIAFLYTRKYSLHSSIFLFIISIVLSVLIITGGIHNTGIFWIYLYPALVLVLKDFKKAVLWNIYFVVLLVLIVVADSLYFIELPYDKTTLRQAIFVYFSLLLLSYFQFKFYAELIDDMKVLAVRDPLTGLYNRAFAFSYLSQEIEKLKRGEVKNVCVAYIDLDNFKYVNDTFGHSVGDSVLNDIGELLSRHFRKEDVVARIGGDEFIVIFTNCDREKIIERLELLREAIERKFQRFGISMSFGIAEAPTDSLLSSFLIRMADERMYKDKGARKKERVGSIDKAPEGASDL